MFTNQLFLVNKYVCICLEAELIKFINPLRANPTELSNTQTIRQQQPTNCLSVFDDLVRLALKRLKLHVQK